MPFIELRDVYKSYLEPGGSTPVPVLRGVNLSIGAGESVSIVGPSGCGKSTLLNLLGTLDEPDQGEVFFDGQSLRGAKPDRLSHLRSEAMGFIFQMHHLLPQCTVLENVLLPTAALAKKPDPAAASAKAMELLKAIGLDHRANHRPAELSGGERQRTAVARALINDPKVILADEPTGALDEKNAELLTDLLLSLVQKFGISLVLVTHNPSQAQRTQRQVHMKDGLLIS